MSYIRFGAMIVTSTVAMFILMYLNTYAWDHVYFSETRVYMAVVMGATMAVIMLAYMLGMYDSWRLNLSIFVGAVFVFAISLWLVRSQATVSGSSYMRAMIPHHSIAIMTSERAQIRDKRVRKLADEIIDAQRREIAEMAYLIAEVSAGQVEHEIYQDPPAKVGTIEDVINNTLISTLDPAPLPAAEADQLIGVGTRCEFRRSVEANPILWVSKDSGIGAMKLNGVLLRLEASGDREASVQKLVAPGVTMTVRPHGSAEDWRTEAELVFSLEQGLTVGYLGFWQCKE